MICDPQTQAQLDKVSFQLGIQQELLWLFGHILRLWGSSSDDQSTSPEGYESSEPNAAESGDDDQQSKTSTVVVQNDVRPLGYKSKADGSASPGSKPLDLDIEIIKVWMTPWKKKDTSSQDVTDDPPDAAEADANTDKASKSGCLAHG